MPAESNSHVHPNPLRGNTHCRSSRGGWTIVLLFAMGGVVLAGLYLAPKATSPPAPPDAKWGTPNARLGFVVCRIGNRPDGAIALLPIIRDVRPDFVFLLDVTADDVTLLAEGLDMRSSYHPQHFQRVTSGHDKPAAGACILSRHPLFEGAAIKLLPRKNLGVSAVSVIDGNKFMVACVYVPQESRMHEMDSLIAYLKRGGSPPAVIAGIVPGDTSADAPFVRLFDGTTTSPPNSSLGFMASRDWPVGWDMLALPDLVVASSAGPYSALQPATLPRERVEQR